MIRVRLVKALLLLVTTLIFACTIWPKSTPTPISMTLPPMAPTTVVYVARFAVFGNEEFPIYYENRATGCIPYRQEYQLQYRGWKIDKSQGDSGHPGMELISSQSDGIPVLGNPLSPPHLSSSPKIELDYQAIADDKVIVEGKICGLGIVMQTYRVYKIH